MSFTPGHCGHLLLSALLQANIAPLGESTVMHCNRRYLFAVVHFLFIFQEWELTQMQMDAFICQVLVIIIVNWLHLDLNSVKSYVYSATYKKKK